MFAFRTPRRRCAALLLLALCAWLLIGTATMARPVMAGAAAHACCVDGGADGHAAMHGDCGSICVGTLPVPCCEHALAWMAHAHRWPALAVSAPTRPPARMLRPPQG